MGSESSERRDQAAGEVPESQRREEDQGQGVRDVGSIGGVPEPPRRHPVKAPEEVWQLTGKAFLDDDGGPGVFAVEEAAIPQALFVRVGPVYDEGELRRKEPGIWVEYQHEYMNSTYLGPLLFDVKTWEALVRAVDKRIYRRNRWGWPRKRKEGA
jgi:hypothetical protein